MTSLPPSVLRARILLRSLEALPGAEARVYDRILGRRRFRASPILRWAIVGLGMCFAASAAYALGYVPTQRFRTATSSLPATGSPPTKKARMPNDVPSATPAVQPSVEPAPLLTPAPRRSVPTVRATPSSAVAVIPPVGALEDPAAESELSMQVSEYRAALDRLPQDPVAALGRLQAHRRAWPKSAIRHEVDLRIIMTLLAVGRASEAQREAQRFLVSYPTSPQHLAVRRIAEAGGNNEPRVE